MEIKERTQQWKEGQAKNITFIVTKDCQLACKYCYLVGKNTQERMSWDVAKKAIDYILDHEEDFKESSVIWDFIGGEPFLEIDLIDKICDYIKQELYRRNHHWFDSYRFSFSTNGINYHTDKVQRFIEKNRSHLSIGVTIDGTPQKHDLNRIWKQTEAHPEERGSYADVVKNIPLWQSQFPGAGTKVTISSADIPYIKDSVIHLFSLGIHEVNINCVFEDVWQEGDDVLFEEQLTQLADVMISEGYYKDYVCSFFGDRIGQPMDCVHDNNNWCGAGKMLSVDAHGDFYPCTRFAQYSLRNKKAWIIGNVETGIDPNKLRPFLALDRCSQSSQECLDCEVADGCAWCQGENYDAADTPTAYQRSTAICKMHKARVRANNYYWNKLSLHLENDQLRQHFGHPIENPVKRLNHKTELKYMVIVLDDASVSYCHYAGSEQRHLISLDALRGGIDFALKHNLTIQFVFPNYPLPEEYMAVINAVRYSSVVPGSVSADSADIVVFDSVDAMSQYALSADGIYILRIGKQDLFAQYARLSSLLGKFRRLNIVITDQDTFVDADLNDYDYILKQWVSDLFAYYKEQHVLPQVNVLTDRIILSEMNNCNAGDTSITLAPDGRFYICPAFYYAGKTDGTEKSLSDICHKGYSVGSVTEGLDIKNAYLYKLDNAPICSACDAYQCRRCVWNNRRKTLEVNTPSREQCIAAHIERRNSVDLLELLHGENAFTDIEIKKVKYFDPLGIIKN